MGLLIGAGVSWNIIEEAAWRALGTRAERRDMGQPVYCGALADGAPGPPLVRDNLVFYGGVAAAALALLLLIVWLRRRSR